METRCRNRERQRRLKGRLPDIPRVRNGGVYRALAGNFPGEVIYITLQNLFWIVSIIWIIIQVWDKFRDKKK
nr:MAG TPA: protein of unknown function (DUF4808) [Caudoviricetes sp.]